MFKSPGYSSQLTIRKYHILDLQIKKKLCIGSEKMKEHWVHISCHYEKPCRKSARNRFFLNFLIFVYNKDYIYTREEGARGGGYFTG